MRPAGKMLLLSDPSVRAAFEDRLDADWLVHRDDAYEALLAMSRRRWPVVVLAAPRPDFAGLCRAARRLQRDSALFGLCTPAAEPLCRELIGDVLNDYFIHPPTRDELNRIRRAARFPAAGAKPAGTKLGPRQLADLIGAAHSIDSLEAAVAALVGDLVAAPVAWTDADDVPPGIKPLLLAADERPRVLRARTAAEPSAETAAVLEDVQECLPALLAAARRTESLHRLAITDHLTGAYNRRYFYHITDRILRRAAERSLRATLLLWDIDDFKRYNDTYGHAAGDEILRETATLMGRASRSHDIVARIGGDEFAVLFWDPHQPRSPDSQPLRAAYSLAERFRRLVGRHDFPSLGPEATGGLTISGGLASFPADGDTCRALLRQADQALRAAKAGGKNAVQLVGRG